MEKWEYAAGREDWRAVPTAWVNDSEPGEYADAEVALIKTLADEDRTSDHQAIGPCIVKRSSRHPEWQPVRDHAAELLAEAMAEAAARFAAHRSDIVQGHDVYVVFQRMATALQPNRENDQEFD